MKKLLMFILIFSFFTACNTVNKYAKDDFLGAKKIKEGLYWETYCIYRGGVYAGNTCTRYLTDSTLFRCYLGSFDDHEQIGITLINDSIIAVRKYDVHTNTTIENAEYNLLTLKREGKFD